MTHNFRFKEQEIGIFNTADASLALSKFDKGCRLVGLTMGRFSLIDMIRVILDHTGPANVVVATWSAGIKDVHQMKWMADSGLLNDFKLLTDHSYVNRQSKYAASIEDLFGKENIRTSEMHAKFVLIYNDEFKVSILSSMNLNANKTCELFEVEEGADLFNFLKDFVEHHFTEMAIGFEPDSNKVSKVVESFFRKYSAEPEKQISKHWSEM